MEAKGDIRGCWRKARSRSDGAAAGVASVDVGTLRGPFGAVGRAGPPAAPRHVRTVRGVALAHAAGVLLAAWCTAAAGAEAAGAEAEIAAQPAAAYSGAPGPAIEALEVVSRPRNGGTYALGEAVELAAVFDGAVDVDARLGTPAVVLVVGSRRFDAAYAGGSGSRELRFRWDVAEGALDADGFEVAAGRIALNGGDIRGRFGLRPVLGHDAVAQTAEHRVDGQRPEVVAGADGLAASGGVLRLRFREPLDPLSVPPPEAFSIIDAAAPDVPVAVSAVAVDRAVVALTLSPAGHRVGLADVSVAYRPPADAARALRDRVGNSAPSFAAGSPAAAQAEVPGAAAAPGAARAAAAREDDRPPDLKASALRRIQELHAAKAARTPVQRKIASRLLDAAATDGGVRTEVDIRADVTPELLARIEALGGEVVDAHPRWRAVRAAMPVGAVEALAAADAVQTIGPAVPAATRNAASAAAEKVDVTEGDAAHGASSARVEHGVDGTGIVVGVMSDGVATLAARQATGDLPAGVRIVAGQGGTGDEGTALLEIVHDLAPGAELMFATGLGSSARFAANVTALCEQGAHIIVDDVFHFREPPFQDGIIAQAMESAVDDGCFVLSAAGNAGNANDDTSSTWEGDFRAAAADADAPALGDASEKNAAVFHDFGDGALANGIVDSGRAFGLSWADPLGASANDYDLFLLDDDGEVVAASTNDQDGTQDPFELILGGSAGERLVVVKYSGADRYLRLSGLPTGRLEFGTPGGVADHSGAERVVAVGAVHAGSATGDGGVFAGGEPVATYSSDGPRRVFFEAEGTPLTPGDFLASGGVVRAKPEVVAADCVSTSTPGFSHFCGTSAAAPHAAAIGALLLEAAGGPRGLTPAAFRAALATGAIDIEADGRDRDSGAGIVMAPGAVGAVAVAAEERNQAPALAAVLADVAATVDVAETIDLAPGFSDPDGDALALTVHIDDADQRALADHLEARADGTNLVLTVAVPAVLRVTVRATDPGGLTALQTFEVAVAAGDRDYDADDDGLVEVATLAALDAVRYDPDADGRIAVADEAGYGAAFPERQVGMGCPDRACTGYELTADLDFDTDGSGAVDAADDHWNDGAGWVPIPVYAATLEGNGHVVRNLLVDRRDGSAGLFHTLSRQGTVRNLGLVGVDVGYGLYAGALAGISLGSVMGVYATGEVTGVLAGGLIGATGQAVTAASHAAVAVHGSNAAHWPLHGPSGGLIGSNSGQVTACYATGRVSGGAVVGGLVGRNRGSIETSYATGPAIASDGPDGKLVGVAESGGTLASSYQEGGANSGRVRTVSDLQGPTSSEGIYADWGGDADGDGTSDWVFGTASQYPALAVDFDGDGTATWQEFGIQLRAAPALTGTVDDDGVALSWTAVDTSHWTAAPTVGYTVVRKGADATADVAAGLATLAYTDTDSRPGVTDRYRVAASVAGGEVVRSPWLRMARPASAALHSMTIGGVDFGTFSSATTDYQAAVGYRSRTAELKAAPADPAASVAISDEFGETAGTRRDLTFAVGVNEIKVTVTAADGGSTRTYVVDVTRAAPVATLVAEEEEVAEGTDAVFTVDFDHALLEAHTVGVGVAETGDMLAGTPPESLAFAVGETSRKLVLGTDDDAVSEDDSDIAVELKDGDGYAVGTPAAATVTVTDDDVVASADAGLSALGLSGIALAFATGTTVYAVDVDHAVASTTVSAVTADARASVSITPSDADSATAGHQVSLAVGANRIAATVTAENGTQRTYAVTVTRAAAPEASVSATAATVGEGGAARFEVSLSAAQSVALSVSVSVTAEGAGLSAPVPTSATFAAGETTAALAVRTVDDAVVSGDGTVTATLSAGAGYALGTAGSASVAVADDDVGEFAVSAQPARIEEGGTSTLTVSIANGVTYAEAQEIALSASGDVSADDYTLPSTLELAAGASSAFAEFAAAADDVDEEPETATVTASLDGAEIGAASVTVADQPPLPALRVEGVPQLGATLSAVFAEPVSGTSAVAAPGTAAGAGVGAASARGLETVYRWLRDGVEIPGATGAAHVLTAADVGAAVSVRAARGIRSEESAATVPVWGAPGNPAVGTDEATLLSTTMTLAASYQMRMDVAGHVALPGLVAFGSLDAAAFALDGTTYRLTAFAVTHAGGFGFVTQPTLPSTAGLVAYWDGHRLSGFEAQELGLDEATVLQAAPSPQPAAEYERYFRAPPRGRGMFGGPSDGTRVAVSLRREVGVPTATVSASSATVSEGGAASFAVSLDGPREAAVTVSLETTVAGAALAAAAPATAAFAPGETQASLDLATADDAVVSGDGTVTVTLVAGDGYELDASTTATVAVAEDDAAQFAVSASPAEVVEGGSSTVTVAIANGVTYAQARDVGLSVSGDVSASDYALPATVALAAGASSATAEFAALEDDAAAEAREEARIAATVDGAAVGAATVAIRPLRVDATLSSLSLTDVDIGAFDAQTTAYAAAVAHDVESTTVAAEASDASATVEIADAAGSTVGTERTSALAEGSNAISATVTAEDGATTRTYAVTVTRPPAWGARRPGRDIELADAAAPTGIWSDGATLWAVADWNGAALRAYDLATGERRTSRDLTLEAGRQWTDLHANGETLWASSFWGGVLAYRLSDGSRSADRDLSAESLSEAGGDRPSGVFSSGGTLWVLDHMDRRAYAHATADGARQAERDVALAWRSQEGGAWPWGAWTDGEVLLTSNWGRGRVLAYRLSDGAAVPAMEVDTAAAGNGDPLGLWSDGATLWVVDGTDRKVYAYAAPGLRQASADSVESRASAVPSRTPGPPLPIPDPALRAALAAALGKPPDSPVGARELAALESLDARAAGITDLSGLEHAVRLTALDLSGNPLADLRALASLPRLADLRLDATGAEPWDVASLAGLRRLSLRGNGIDSIDALSALRSLEHLDIGGNRIADLAALANLHRLADLRADGNRVADVAPLLALPSLATLDLRGNPVDDTEALERLPRIQP